ncbi:MAG: hypothetical protein EOP48_33535 [Sphingobacteriales bacterium]|nr:MAG: hypothetical protein EOP48_33535 [Sphingobacteriales bacterium]
MLTKSAISALVIVQTEQLVEVKMKKPNFERYIFAALLISKDALAGGTGLITQYISPEQGGCIAELYDYPDGSRFDVLLPGTVTVHSEHALTCEGKIAAGFYIPFKPLLTDMIASPPSRCKDDYTAYRYWRATVFPDGRFKMTCSNRLRFVEKYHPVDKSIFDPELYHAEEWSKGIDYEAYLEAKGYLDNLPD